MYIKKSKKKKGNCIRFKAEVNNDQVLLVKFCKAEPVNVTNAVNNIKISLKGCFLC